MKSPLLLLFLLLLAGVANAQTDVHLTAGSNILFLPTTSFIRPNVPGSRANGVLPSFAFSVGLAVRRVGPSGKFPLTLKLDYGHILDAELRVTPATTAPYELEGRTVDSRIAAQARFLGASYWQPGISLGILSVPHWRKFQLTAGFGGTFITRQRSHLAVAQFHPETGVPEQPAAAAAYVIDNGELRIEPQGERQLVLRDKLLRPASAYVELGASASQTPGTVIELRIQYGLRQLADPALFGSRLDNSRWFAVGIYISGKLFTLDKTK